MFDKFKFNSFLNPNVYIGTSAQRIARNYIFTFYQFGFSLMEEVMSSNKQITKARHRVELTKEEKEKLTKSAKLLAKCLDLTTDYSSMISIFNELRLVYFSLGTPDSLARFIEKVPEEQFFSELHFFKGQLQLDKLVLNKDITEEEKKAMALKSEEEFRLVLDSEKDVNNVNGYIGLLDLYEELGYESEKESLIATIINKPKVYTSVFMYNYDFKKDTVMSVYLLRKWLEVNPYDNKAKVLLDSLSTNF